jgi:general secretion pathway protein F
VGSFILVGINTRGELQRVELHASDLEDAEQEATRTAKRIGLRVIEIRTANAGRSALFRRRHAFDLLRRNSFDLALFVYELMTLLRAGLSLTEALEALDERWREKRSTASTNTTASHMPGELVRQMQQGKAFSTALSAYPALFPGLFVAMIAASEQTGEMTQALDRFLQYHGQINVVRQKLISASLYPALLLLTGFAVAFFLVWFLAPRFAHVYEGMTHTELPLLSQRLLNFGLFISDHTAESLACLLAAFVALAAMFTRPSVQQRCVATLVRIGWIGGTLKLMQLARFYRSLGMLLQGGVALLPSLKMTRDLLPLTLQASLMRSITSIGQGKPMSESMQHEGLLTPVALRLLQAGERNGQIANMLEQSALFHEHEITRWVERFARLIEPVLMLVMGASIGVIVVLLYLPIFDLAGSLE